MRRTLIAIVVVAAASIVVSADEGLQKARFVSIRIIPKEVSPTGKSVFPIFDGHPVYDFTMDWKGKKYLVRYEAFEGLFSERDWKRYPGEAQA